MDKYEKELVENYDLSKSCRLDGSWVEGECPRRMTPCGNPFCADEAMRSGELSDRDYVSGLQSEQAYDHARKIARECFENGTECPLGKNLKEVFKILDELKDMHKLERELVHL